jgi:polyisoprenyl-teichoic acid--peptidoglycan teichoic acid transferase
MTDEAPAAAAPRPRGGARRAAKSSRIPRRRRPEVLAADGTPYQGGGRRAMRERHRRARGLPSTLALTVLGAVVPGSGYLYTGRRALGGLVLLAWAAAAGALAWYFGRDVSVALDLAFSPTMLRAVALLLGIALVVWAFVVFTSYRLIRPRSRRRWHTAVGYVAVVALVITGGAPVVRAAEYALVTADTVDTVFADDPDSATTPEGATKEDPWAGQDRVNVLLLGGDGGEGRTGVRTDTVILASIDTASGNTLLFSLPRNLMYAEFPEDSPLHDLYPNGFGREDPGSDPGFYMLNAVYGQIPERYPGILGKSDNEGADAVKQAVEGSLGVPVDYYLLVNLKGFRQVVDAIGGITVNINEPVAIQGDTSAGIPPVDYLDPGPDQHLDGYHALWFARGRYGSDDYARMDRQRCTIDAMIEAADPQTIITRYREIVQAGQEIVYTDVPRRIADDFVQLLLKVKDGKIRSVVFRSSDQFNSSDPDYDYVRETVQNALNPPPREPGAPKVRRAEDPVDVCAYNPVDGSGDETVSAASE